MKVTYNIEIKDKVLEFSEEEALTIYKELHPYFKNKLSPTTTTIPACPNPDTLINRPTEVQQVPDNNQQYAGQLTQLTYTDLLKPLIF